MTVSATVAKLHKDVQVVQSEASVSQEQLKERLKWKIILKTQTHVFVSFTFPILLL